MALTGGTLLIREADAGQFAIIKSWGKMKYARKEQQFSGYADLDLLDKLAGIVRLPPAVEARRQRLRKVQDAVDRERLNPDPVPLADYPVKVSLYRHQLRGANMAMLTFGWVPPPEGGGKDG
jgi:hypothetical protein